MSDSIRKGDVVMIVRPTICCGSEKHIGLIFTVGSIVNGLGRCTTCKKFRVADAAIDNADQSGTDLVRLKKIPPLSELESQTSSLDNPIKEPHKENV